MVLLPWILPKSRWAIPSSSSAKAAWDCPSLVYYTQQKYRQQHHTYANSLADLGISSAEAMINGIKNTLVVEGSKYQYLATITDANGRTWTINNDGLIHMQH
ncbi:MAG: hypothetical protein JKY70_18300 [Mucilaginibacter sp.]|nr:hypothetical protein [Mucilaginibacter sp.]